MTAAQSAPAQHTRLASLPISQVLPDGEQDRKHFDPEALLELADSIRSQGLLQPITVRLGAEDSFVIIGGERRWRAAQIAGLTHIDAIVRLDVLAGQQHALQLIENLQRADLTLAEQMIGVGRLVDSVGVSQAATELGKDKAWISRVANLRQIWAPARELVASGHITSPDLAHELHKLASMGDDGAKAATTLVGYFTRPPSHRLHTPTREEVRSAIKLQSDIRTSRKAVEQEKAQQAKREIAADNHKGYDSSAGDPPRTPAQSALDKSAEARASAKRAAADEAEREERALQREEKRDQRERLLAACFGFKRHEGTGSPTGAGHCYTWDDAVVEFELSAREHAGEVTYTLSLDLSPLDVERLAERLSQRSAPKPALPAGITDADLAPVREFLRLRTRPSPGAHIRASWLQDQFAEWRAASGEKAMPRPRVAALIEACGVATKRAESGKTYLNITPVSE